MKRIMEGKFTGERALFQSEGQIISYSVFDQGESPLKESKNISVDNCVFKWKYPFWYCDEIKVSNSAFFEMARAGIWYSQHVIFEDVTIKAPKAFRQCKDISLKRVDMTNAAETLWQCSHIKLEEVTASGDYFAMGSSDIEVDGLTLVGDYSFDGAKNVTIRNSKLLSKDAFWNSENITVYDSFISGEYLGWNAKNLTLINCTVESLQGFCYIDHLVMKNCKCINTNLAFEYSTVDVSIDGKIDSIKNPISGIIRAQEIDDIILDDPKINTNDINICIGNHKEHVAS